MQNKVDTFFEALTVHTTESAVADNFDKAYSNPSAPGIIDSTNYGPARMAYDFAAFSRSEGPEYPWITALLAP